MQEAVNNGHQPGMIIKILPGVYLEEPSLAEPAGRVRRPARAPGRRSGYQVLSYEQQVACPHNQNLVAILGKKNLQIEGTGASREDVLIDAQYKKLNAIRADNSDGVYFTNLTVQRTTFNALYIMETDGFVIDNVIGRWNDEYGFLTFAVDHGLYTDCEALRQRRLRHLPGRGLEHQRGPGPRRRRATPSRSGTARATTTCWATPGTAGDSVWVHDNEFTDNTAGVATDSAFPGHPGLPQNHACSSATSSPTTT